MSIYRAFNYLHARVLLELQDELRCLEDNLADLDAEYFYSDDPRQQARVTSRDADMEEARLEMEEAARKRRTQSSDTASSTAQNEKIAVPVSRRAALLVDIRTKLVEYDEMLVKVREVSEFKRPSDRDYLAFRTWFWNIKPLSFEAEEEFVRKKGDLITTLSPRAEWGKFDGWVEELIPKLPKLFSKVCIPSLRLLLDWMLTVFTSSSVITNPVELHATHLYLTTRFLESRNSPP